ncbi:MAG TPA: hypothetical protein VH253_08545 [Phycisphaerae bacterium]|nr:hypothetical protein [Phycisphaerae bacterium]
MKNVWVGLAAAVVAGGALVAVTGAGVAAWLIEARRASAAAPAAPDVPPGYTLVKATSVGKAMTAEKPTASSIHAAIEAGLDDLDDYFDTDYDVTHDLESRDHRTGVSTFEAQYKGKKVKGYVLGAMRDKGAAIVIVFAQSTATHADWAQLTGTPQPGAGGGAAAGGAGAGVPAAGGAPADQDASAALAKAAAAIPLQVYRFPDGTGTIGLPQGWTTTAQSCHTTFTVDGPGGAKVNLGMSLSVNTPNSTAVRLARQYPTNIPMLVAPWTDPASALQALAPQLSAIQQRSGGPAVALDHVLVRQKLKPVLANSQNAIVSYGATHGQGGREEHFEAISQVMLTPISNESYSVWMTEMAAPDAAFQQDLPAMIAIVNSWKTDDAVMQQKTDQWIAASNARFQAQQAANRDLQNTYDRYNQAQATNSVIRSRSVDDFDETIRGVRDVRDTRTGEVTPVDLGNVDNIVDNLNRGDPGRFVQVPLRDEADPLPRQR